VSAFEKWLLHLSVGTAGGTGLAYLFMKHVLKSEDPFSVVNHPWQPHVLAAHVLLTPLLIFSLGLIAREHILGRFIDPRPHRSRRSGVATLTLALPMAASGYLAQVSTSEPLRRALVLVHVVSGCLFALLFLAHLVAARPERRARTGRRSGGRPRRGRAGVRRLAWPEERVIESQTRSESTLEEAGPGGRRA
jgi:hypothetical protein